MIFASNINLIKIDGFKVVHLIDHDEHVSTAFFSEEKSANTTEFTSRKRIPSASSALVIGGFLGLLQALLLVFGAKPILNYMGVKYVSIYSPIQF